MNNTFRFFLNKMCGPEKSRCEHFGLLKIFTWLASVSFLGTNTAWMFGKTTLCAMVLQTGGFTILHRFCYI